MLGSLGHDRANHLPGGRRHPIMSSDPLAGGTWDGSAVGTDVGTGSTRTVRVELRADPELDAQDRERLTLGLRTELNELDVDSVHPAEDGTAPAGAKGADAVTIGALLVALSAPGGVFTSVIATLQSWLDRQADAHRITVTIDGDTLDLGRAAAADQRAVVDAFVRRHGDG